MGEKIIRDSFGRDIRENAKQDLTMAAGEKVESRIESLYSNRNRLDLLIKSLDETPIGGKK